MPDNYSQWLAHEAYQDKLLVRLPVCRCCGEPIQDDHYFYIDGVIYCEDCLNDNFRRHIEDYYY